MSNPDMDPNKNMFLLMTSIFFNLKFRRKTAFCFQPKGGISEKKAVSTFGTTTSWYDAESFRLINCLRPSFYIHFVEEII
jgi:hypothetical protein